MSSELYFAIAVGNLINFTQSIQEKNTLDSKQKCAYSLPRAGLVYTMLLHFYAFTFHYHCNNSINKRKTSINHVFANNKIY